MRLWHDRNSLLFTLTVFAVLYLLRREILFDPPYQDQIYAWDEATFLAESDFNYYALRYEQNSGFFDPAGRRAYMISIMPTIWAIFLRSFERPERALAAAHLLNILAAALASNVIRRMIAPAVGSITSILGAIGFLSVPAVLFQIDMIGLYMPFCYIMLRAVEANGNRQDASAAIFGFASFLVKATGLLVTATLIFQAIVVSAKRRFGRSHLADQGSNRPPSSARRVLLSNIGIFAAEIGLLAWGGAPSNLRLGEVLLDWLDYGYLFRLCPDVLIVAIAGATLPVMAWAARRTKVIGPTETNDSWNMIPTMWVLLVVMLTAIAVMPALPRYMVPALALAVPLAVLSLGNFPIPRGITQALLTLWVCTNAFNASGALYANPSTLFAEELDSLPFFDPRHSTFTERSLEYVDDHHRVVGAIRDLADRFPDDRFLFPEPYFRTLMSPAMGYVKHPVALAEFDNGPAEVILMRGREYRLLDPRIDRGDELVLDDRGKFPILYYRAAVPSAKKDPTLFVQWALSRVEQERWPVLAALLRAAIFDRYGFHERARREIESLSTLSLHGRDARVRDEYVSKFFPMSR